MSCVVFAIQPDAFGRRQQRLDLGFNNTTQTASGGSAIPT
jgi:hypothetical protein